MNNPKPTASGQPAPGRHPDQTVERSARAAGANVECLWQVKGPKGTLISWIECLAINASVVLVETYRDGGWEVFSTCNSGRVDDSIADVLTRCGLKPPAAVPTPVATESRICFGIAWFATEQEANAYHAHVCGKGYTYNGGMFHGRPCGRDSSWDREVRGQRQFAVTH